MQPSVLISLAPGQRTLFKWQRFLMAQGQGGAWCKVGDSGGSSESLLRQCQRFLVGFFCHSLSWGLQCNCVASAFQAGGGQLLWQSTEAHVTDWSCWWEWELQEHLAGGKESGVPPSHCSAAAGICSFVSGCSGQSSPRYCGTRGRVQVTPCLLWNNSAVVMKLEAKCCIYCLWAAGD